MHWSHVRVKAFTAAEFNKIFPSHQMCHMFQGWTPSSESDVIMDKNHILFGLTFSPDWCISVLLDHTCCRVPGSLTLKPLSMLKSLGWSLISTTSFIKLPMYPVALSSMEVLLKLILCPVSKHMLYHNWLLPMAQVYTSYVILTSGLSSSAHLSNMSCRTLRDAIHTCGFELSLSLMGLRV
jgi:hypothetical protein